MRLVRTITRNTTLRLHLPRATATLNLVPRRKTDPPETVTGQDLLRAVVRTHVIANLGVAYYCERLRHWLRVGKDAAPGTASHAAHQLIRELLTGAAHEAKQNSDPEPADLSGSEQGSDRQPHGPPRQPKSRRKPQTSQHARGRFSELTNPNCQSAELRAARATPDVSAHQDRLLTDLLADPDLISRREIADLIGTTGHPKSWLIRSETTESGWQAQRPWTPTLQKKLNQLVTKIHCSPDDAQKPLATLVRAGWLDRAHPHHIHNLLQLLGTTDSNLNVELAYGAFSQAVSRLATAQTNTGKRQTERKLRDQQVKTDFADLLTADWWHQLEQYERASQVYYEQVSGQTMRQPYRLGQGHELKGWTKIRQLWLRRRWHSGPAPTATDLRALRLAEQQRRPQEHGDHRLFDWLAEPDQWSLWDGRDAPDPADHEAPVYDRISLRQDYHRQTRHVPGIGFSWPDPLCHPIWQTYGDGARPSNSNNLPWRTLIPAGHGRGLDLALIFTDDHATYQQRLVHLTVGENRRCTYHPETGDLLFSGRPATIGGGRLVLQRAILERAYRALSPTDRQLLIAPAHVTRARVEQLVDAICATPALRDGQLAVHLSLAMQLTPIPTASCFPLRKTAVKFSRPLPSGELLLEHLLPATLTTDLTTAPLRILGIDLGERTAAAGAVIEVAPLDSQSRVCRPHRPLGVAGLTAVLERTFSLKLPGESATPPPRLTQARVAIQHASITVKQQNQLARWLRQATTATDQATITGLAADLQAFNAPDPPTAGPDPHACQAAVHQLQSVSANTPDQPALTSALTAALRAYDQYTIAWHQAIHQLMAHPAALAAGRAAQHPQALRPSVSRADAAMGGLSVARLSLLDDLLRYYKQHATRARSAAPDPRRLRRGTNFMPHWHTRLKQLKLDRCRKIAAGIIEAALGGPPDPLTGQRPWAPVQVIALEDLFRYRFANDRSRRENQRLMRWSHQEIFKWVVLGARLEGLLVAAVPAGYTSRFDALTGAPGIRLNYLQEEWLTQAWWQKRCDTDAAARAAQPGDLVPQDGGPYFMGLAGAHPRRVNADENAAVNIARRFLRPPEHEPISLRLIATGGQRYRQIVKHGTGLAFKLIAGEPPYFQLLPPDGSPTEKSGPGDHDGTDVTDEVGSTTTRTTIRIFRDPSGTLFQGRWISREIFWGAVRQRALTLLKKNR
jgi:hypothetical protein